MAERDTDIDSGNSVTAGSERKQSQTWSRRPWRDSGTARRQMKPTAESTVVVQPEDNRVTLHSNDRVGGIGAATWRR